MRISWVFFISFAAAAVLPGQTGSGTGAQLVDASAHRDRVKALALIRQGASPETQASDGRTILGIWSCAGDVAVVQALVQHGAKINGGDRLNRTPLMYAAICRQTAMAKILLSAGADRKLTDGLGFTYDIYLAASPDMPQFYVSALEMLQRAGPHVGASTYLDLPPGVRRPPGYDPEIEAKKELDRELKSREQQQWVGLAREYASKAVAAAGSKSAEVEEKLRAAFEKYGYPYYPPGTAGGPAASVTAPATAPAAVASPGGTPARGGKTLDQLMGMLNRCDVDSARELVASQPAIAAAIRKEGHEALATVIGTVDYGRCPVEAATFLLQHAAQPNLRTSTGATALTLLVGQRRSNPRAPRAKILEALLGAGANPNLADASVTFQADLRGLPPLFYATVSWDTTQTGEALRQSLVQAGADKHLEKAWRRFQRTDFNCEDLVALSASGTKPAIEDYMRKQSYFLADCPSGRAVNLSDNLSPVLAAVLLERTDMLEFLVQAGADVNVQSPAGVSALMIAEGLGANATRSVLLQLGADPSLRDIRGRDSKAWGAPAQRRLRELTRGLAQAMTNYGRLGPMIKVKARQENERLSTIQMEEARRRAVDIIGSPILGRRGSENEMEYQQRVSEERAAIAAASDQRETSQTNAIKRSSNLDELDRMLKHSYQPLLTSVRCGLLTSPDAREDLGVTIDLMGLVPGLAGEFRRFYSRAEVEGDFTNCRTGRP